MNQTAATILTSQSSFLIDVMTRDSVTHLHGVRRLGRNEAATVEAQSFKNTHGSFQESCYYKRSETTLLYCFLGETVRISPNSIVMYSILARIKIVFERIRWQN